MTLSLASAFAGLAAARERRRTAAAAAKPQAAKGARPVWDDALAPYMTPSYEPFRDYRAGWGSGDAGRRY